MAYVPAAEHDVFVSYAHLDNVGPEGDTRQGWIDTFIERLSIQVCRRLGSKAVDVWTDRQQAGNQALTPSLLRAVRESALLLVVMSPSYLSSTWCARERNTFLELANDRVAEGRIFIVNYLDAALELRPREFGDLTGFPFWIVDRAFGATRPLGESDPTESEFVGRLYALSQHIANELRRLAAVQYGSARVIEGAKASGRHGVLVARATDDLEEREQELRNHLLQAGLATPPRRLYIQANEQEFEAAVIADLQPCKVFVQLLSAARGPEMAFEDQRRLPGRLFDIARRASVKIMRWRDCGVDLSSVTDPAHRALLEGAIACPIEEFKRLVVDEARRVPAPSRPRPAKVIVFVDTDPGDRELARAVGEVLAREGVRCYFPLDSGTPEQIRKDVEANLQDCDGVLVVYGTSEVDSVRTKLRYDGKIMGQREAPPATLAVFEGPPADADKLKRLLANMMDPDVMVIDSADGVSPERLQPFIARLRGA
jgi:TIR domain